MCSTAVILDTNKAGKLNTRNVWRITDDALAGI